EGDPVPDRHRNGFRAREAWRPFRLQQSQPDRCLWLLRKRLHRTGESRMTCAGDPRRFDDLFQAFGPITIRRFFGGEGIYSSEVMIGMVFDDLVYLTTDKETRKPFV